MKKVSFERWVQVQKFKTVLLYIKILNVDYLEAIQIKIVFPLLLMEEI